MSDHDARLDNIGMPPWDAGDVIKAVVFSVIVITAGLFALLASATALRLGGVPVRSLRVALTIAQTVVQNVVFLAAIWLFGLRKYRAGPASLGLRPFPTRVGCSSSLVAFMTALGFNIVYSVIVALGTGRQVQPTPILPLFGGGLIGLILALVIGALIVPFVEELFFRGFIFPGLASRFGFVAGIILSAVVFGAAHLNPDTFVPLSFFGLVLALLYSVTGSIFPGIMLHSVNNAFALVIAYLMEISVVPTL